MVKKDDKKYKDLAGLYLIPNQGQLIYDSQLPFIVKSRRFINKEGLPHILVSGDGAYGIITLHEPKVIKREEVHDRKRFHPEVESEWQDAPYAQLYQYPFTFTKFTEPLHYERKRGVRTFDNNPIIKKADYALGIPNVLMKRPPRSIKSPELWNFNIQRHDAKRAHLHFDLRLVDPQTGIAHSWATRYLPTNPGEKVLVTQQPDHTAAYSTWEGTIPEGYGAGTVKLFSSDKVEVTKSQPGEVLFNVYKTNGDTARYALIQTGGDKWLFTNVTPTKTSRPELNISKPHFKQVSIKNVDINNAQEILAPKIDGAMNVISLRPHKPVEVFSYRPSKKGAAKVIDHTFRSNLYTKIVPPSMKGTTILLGEVFARNNKTGKVMTQRDTSARLLSNVWKSRNLQETGQLKIMPWGILQYQNKDVSELPYSQKLELLQQINKQIPEFESLPLAQTPQEKQKLLATISNEKHPDTKEGVVIYNRNKPWPIKAKLFHDYDVVIHSMFPGEGKWVDRGVGGFYYLHPGSNKVVGKTGSGFSDKERIEMFHHPEKYVGQLARVLAQEQLPSGALRMPVFKDIRAEKWPRHKMNKQANNMDKAEIIMEKLSTLDWGAIYHDYVKPSIITGAPVGAAVYALTKPKQESKNPQQQGAGFAKAMTIGAGADITTAVASGIWKQKKNFLKSLAKPVVDTAENIAAGGI